MVSAARLVNKMAFPRLVFLSTLLAAVAASTVNHRACSDVSGDFCSVSQVRMHPCKRPYRCALIRGDNGTTLSFDFTPKFSAENVETQVYFRNMPIAPFLGVTTPTDCDATSCRTTSGVSQTFNYHLYVAKRLPLGTFPISWKVWNINNTEEVCCFETNIRLKK